jgi:hypothetical protein
MRAGRVAVVIGVCSALLAGAGAAPGGVPCGSQSRDFLPSFSPDGSRIAFLRGGGGGCTNSGRLYVADFADAVGRELTTDDVSEPTWSADGTQLAFAAGRNIDVIGADGTRRRTVARGARPRWSPAGSQILFLDTTVPAAGPYGQEDFPVRAVPSVGGSTRLLAAAGRTPEWSPNGRSIAFFQRDRLVLVRSDGIVLDSFPVGGVISPPLWSPDGAELAFGEARRDAAALSVVRRDGTVAAHVERSYRYEEALLAGKDFRSLTEPVSWAPDGSRLMLSGGEVVRVPEGTTFLPFPQEAVVAIDPSWTHRALGLESGPIGYSGADLYLAESGVSRRRHLSGSRCNQERRACRVGTDGGDVVRAAVNSAGSVVYAYSGDDRVYGASGMNRLEGAFGNDLLVGGPENDTLRGQAGDDRLVGHGGLDVLIGDYGDDVLIGGKGTDFLFAGPGNDVVDARDGGHDFIRCGPGRDVAYVDRRDKVEIDYGNFVLRDCERAIRR